MNIAFVFDDLTLQQVGVTNYVLALGRTLQNCGHNIFNLLHRRRDLCDEYFSIELPVSNTYNDSVSVNGLAKNILSDWRKLSFPIHFENLYTLRTLESDLSCLKLDLAVFSAPWINTVRLPKALLVAGICLDVIPIEYALSTGYPIDFALQHTSGFRRWLELDVAILFISEETKRRFNLIPFSQLTLKNSSSDVIPPIATNAGLLKTRIRRDRSILCLAAPFDPRKGLVANQSTYKLIEPYFDEIKIFGRPRCDPSYVDRTLSMLGNKKTEWFLSPSDQVIADIYSQSRYLLFPSDDEGLGLPIIDAQCHGCSVIIQDKEPMKSISLPGSAFIDQLESNLDALIFEEGNSMSKAEALKKSALNTFDSPINVNRWLNQMMSGLNKI